MQIHIYSLTHYKSEKSEVGFKGIEAYFTFFCKHRQNDD